MNVLTPILAKMVPLFGFAVTWDSVAFDHSTDEVPNIQTPHPTIGPDGQPEAEPQVLGTEQIPSARLKTELLMPFSVYVPRECQDPNTSDLVIRRNRMDVGVANRRASSMAWVTSARSRVSSRRSTCTYSRLPCFLSLASSRRRS
jgi:hypothetical protein